MSGVEQPTIEAPFQHVEHELYKRDVAAALGAIKARVIVMLSSTDFLFQLRDSAAEVAQIPNAELRPIPSRWGHVAGFGANPPDNDVVDAAIEELLAA